jgi:tRNA (cytidine/uridine-2'-O-)-methyltransferase
MPIYLATTKGARRYTDVSYEEDAMLLFGKETAGLPGTLIDEYKDRTIRIPMGMDTRLRSLNLSNSVSIVLFEALRQKAFPNLE